MRGNPYTGECCADNCEELSNEFDKGYIEGTKTERIVVWSVMSSMCQYREANNCKRDKCTCEFKNCWVNKPMKGGDV